jgi:hypothetical protein
MSRYVCHFLVNLSPQNVRLPLKMLFEACGMETMYETDDYVMAREIPGQIIFTKLVTSEVSIDVSRTNPDLVKLSFLVKNEELPLNSNNHCRQIFDLIMIGNQSIICHKFQRSPRRSQNQSRMPRQRQFLSLVKRILHRSPITSIQCSISSRNAKLGIGLKNGVIQFKVDRNIDRKFTGKLSHDASCRHQGS